jgi:hypothetical protein
LKTGELKAQVIALEKTIDTLEARLQLAEDIEAVKKLQRAYGYYLEHWQEEEIVGLFSHSPEVSVEIHDTGLYQGWEAVGKSFHFEDHYTAFNGEKASPPEFLHILIPRAGMVHIDPDSKRAKGRWYGFGLAALNRGGKLRPLIGSGIWENEYVKEDGKWKILKIFWNEIIASPLEEGWVKTPYIANPPAKNQPPPSPNTHPATYPSGYIFPYHYKNPVTGR